MEVLRLDLQLERVESELETLEEAKNQAYQELFKREERQEDRYDRLIQKQEEILDSRLGLGQPVRKEGEPALKPMGRKNWPTIAAKHEADSRKDYWEKQIKLREEKEKTKQTVETKS